MFQAGNNDGGDFGPPQQQQLGYVDPDLVTMWNGAVPDITTDDYNYYWYHHHLAEQGGGEVLGQTPLLHHNNTPPPPPPPPAAGSSGDYGGGHHEQLDGNNENNKKVNRKEIERLRRKQMSDLQSSLVSLLPPHSRKGKRSMSDHMGEAVNYIKHLESNIGELSTKRDKLKGSVVDQQQLTNPDDESARCSRVTVRPHSAGVEVVISSGGGGGEKGFRLSKVVEAVMEEGFDVTSCVSTRRHGRFYNTMQCQAIAGGRYIDLPQLQRKLNHVMLSYK